MASIDFSRDILAHHVERLLLLRDSGSGWADLGSPGQVLEILARIDIQPPWVSQIRGLAEQVRSLRGVL